MKLELLTNGTVIDAIRFVASYVQSTEKENSDKSVNGDKDSRSRKGQQSLATYNSIL